MRKLGLYGADTGHLLAPTPLRLRPDRIATGNAKDDSGLMQLSFRPVLEKRLDYICPGLASRRAIPIEYGEVICRYLESDFWHGKPFPTLWLLGVGVIRQGLDRIGLYEPADIETFE